MNPEGCYFLRPGVVSVSWDPQSSSVHLETQGGWADSAEFQAASEAVIEGLRAHRASRLLGNGRNLRVVKQADQDWMSDDWMPRAIAAGLRRMALVIPKSVLARMNLEQMVGKAPEGKLETAYFETLEEARAWLNLSPVRATSGAVTALEP
ncbi:MAG TPA: STAS/SEC14 domain-containing protein [Candidatus Dormibacteraeota bacterium]|jgi:hypothetical protein